MRALSIRQPYAELILRGIKQIEYRSRPTRIIGERFWIYAAGKKWSGVSGRWPVKQADNIVVPSEPLPPWMLELAEGLRLFPHELPTGVIVGSAVIERCSVPVPSLRPIHPLQPSLRMAPDRRRTCRTSEKAKRPSTTRLVQSVLIFPGMTLSRIPPHPSILIDLNFLLRFHLFVDLTAHAATIQCREQKEMSCDSWFW